MARSFAQALIEVPAKTQVLKGWWQGHQIQALVELLSKIQALKARWQSHPLHALVESNAKTKASKARWQGHPLQALIELKTKSLSQGSVSFRFSWCTTSFVPGLYGSFSDTNLRRSYPSIERGTLDLTPTAPEDRTHQFHLHLFQWMMDPRSHVVHRTLVNINSSLLGKTERSWAKLLPKL